MPVVTVLLNNRTETLACEPGVTLKELLTAHGIYVDAPCGGTGKCGKCIVAAWGGLSDPTEKELSLGKDRRLACLTRVTGDCTVRCGAGEAGMDVSLSGVGESFGAFAGATGLGAAVDIGTTTVVCRLFDLGTGRELGAMGGVNLQRSFGADVISRIGACVENKDSLRAMTKSIRDQIAKMLFDLCREACMNTEEILSLVIAGNTTMAHLFAGLDPSGMAALPFEPESLFGESFTPCGDGLGLSPEAEVYIIPAASAFVGGDITAAALSQGMDKTEDTVLLIDIGTNGEIVLAHGGELFCCATAAGPAFEGADISCGMGGSEGAIRAVETDGKGALRLDVIGGGEAKGICGSGLVDAVGVMLGLGAVEYSGRMLFPDEAEGTLAEAYLDEDDNGDAVFRLSENIAVSAGDVRKLQLAKAAIAAGARTLLDRAGVSADKVTKLLIAGGFGNSIRVKNAAAMGLIPAELGDRALSVGNAAAEGACAALCSPAARERAEKLGKAMKYVDLSADPVFMEHYVEEMFFGEE